MAVERVKLGEAWRLVTDRLQLRPFELTDTGWYAAIRAKPEVVRYLPGGEATTARAQPIAVATVAHFAKAWTAVGYGPWAVVERRTGRPIGHAGVRHIAEMGETEVLYMLDSSAWGLGYATEAALAARDFAFEVLQLGRLAAFVVPENLASVAVIEKLGMTFEGIGPAFGLEVARYGLANGAG